MCVKLGGGERKMIQIEKFVVKPTAVTLMIMGLITYEIGNVKKLIIGILIWMSGFILFIAYENKEKEQ